MKEKQCPKCGCEKISIRETYGPMCSAQKWRVCDACATIIEKAERVERVEKDEEE